MMVVLCSRLPQISECGGHVSGTMVGLMIAIAVLFGAVALAPRRDRDDN